MGKPVLVGELNPFGGDPQYALYPLPEGCTGHRLCHKVLGMTPREYMRTFVRVNLCVGKWSWKNARWAVMELRGTQEGPFVLLGSKVCQAWGVKYEPFTRGEGYCVLPHPSGLCRLWNEPGSFERARKVVRELVPGLVEVRREVRDA